MQFIFYFIHAFNAGFPAPWKTLEFQSYPGKSWKTLELTEKAP